MHYSEAQLDDIWTQVTGHFNKAVAQIPNPATYPIKLTAKLPPDNSHSYYMLTKALWQSDDFLTKEVGMHLFVDQTHGYPHLYALTHVYTHSTNGHEMFLLDHTSSFTSRTNKLKRIGSSTQNIQPPFKSDEIGLLVAWGFNDVQETTRSTIDVPYLLAWRLQLDKIKEDTESK